MALPKDLGTRFDLEGLPPELAKQLTQRGGKGLDYLVPLAITTLDGTATTNEIMVHIYRETGTIYQRTAVQGALYRLIKAGSVMKLGESVWSAVP